RDQPPTGRRASTNPMQIAIARHPGRSAVSLYVSPAAPCAEEGGDVSIRKLLVAASSAIALLLTSGLAHAQNPQKQASARAEKAKGPDALLGSTWAHMPATALRSLPDLQRFTARELAARRDDPVAAALRTDARITKPAQSADMPRLHVGVVHAAV